MCSAEGGQRARLPGIRGYECKCMDISIPRSYTRSSTECVKERLLCTAVFASETGRGGETTQARCRQERLRGALWGVLQKAVMSSRDRSCVSRVVHGMHMLAICVRIISYHKSNATRWYRQLLYTVVPLPLMNYVTPPVRRACHCSSTPPVRTCCCVLPEVCVPLLFVLEYHTRRHALTAVQYGCCVAAFTGTSGGS